MSLDRFMELDFDIHDKSLSISDTCPYTEFMLSNMAIYHIHIPNHAAVVMP